MYVIVFTGGAAPEPELNESFFTTQMKQPVVVAADSGLDTLIKYQSYFKDKIDLSPAYILGDMDSIADRQSVNLFPRAVIEQFPCDKDFSDTELALEKAYAVKGKADKIVLVGGSGGRIDHLLALYDTFSTKQHADIWLYGYQKLYFTQKGDCVTITNLEKNDIISVARATGSRTIGSISSHGLQWEGSTFRKQGMASLSNRKKDEAENQAPVELLVKSGMFLLIVPARAAVCVSNSCGK